MKCPTCGTENKSTNKACYRCGTVVNDSGMQPKGNANSLWYNKAERQDKQVPPPFWGDTSGKPTYDDKSDFIVLHDVESNSNAAQDIVNQGGPAPDNRRKLGKLTNGREINVVLPAAKPAPRVYASTGRRYKIKWRRLVFSTLALIILFAGVSYGVFSLYKLAVGAASQYIADNRSNAPKQEPLVEVVTIDGKHWHRITFYGKDGDMVLVDNPKRTLPIQNGKAVLMLDDQGYIPQNLTEKKVTVSLEASIISPDNTQTKITVRPYDIDVPLAPLKLILPQQAAVTTDQDSMLVKIKVTPGSTRVLIGEWNETDSVSPDGYASATISLKPNTINDVKIVVMTANSRQNTFDLMVNRPVMDVPITIDGADKVTNNSTENSTIAISGSTAPGATISTNAILKGTITQHKTTGIFSFTVSLKRWGWNDITITSTAANGSTSTLTHRINHEPTLKGYTGNAWPLDYSYLTTSTAALVGQNYQIDGMIQKKYESDVSDYYLFNAGTPSDPKMLVVEYTKEDGLKPNQFYRLWADVTGTYENLPLLTVRFTSALPTPTSYGTAAPGASPTPQVSASPDDSASPKPTTKP